MSPEERHLLLLASARSVFTARGYHRTGVADIIREAGVARGTFYNYFDSKRSVFTAVLADVMNDVLSGVRPIDVSRPLGEQLVLNLRSVIAAACAPDVARLLFAEAVGIDAEGDAALKMFYDLALARIEKALVDGHALGILRELDTPVAARCLLGMVKEPGLQAALRGEEPDVDRLVATLAGLLSVGLGVG